MEKIPINGIKISGPLIPIRFHVQGVDMPDITPRFCRLLSDMQVNIAFLTSAGMQIERPGLYCIDSADRPAVASAVLRDEALSRQVSFGPEVGLLSFFPHRSRLETLGVALRALVDGGISVHGFATSIATITFVIDYDDLDKGAGLLSEVMALPPAPASFRPEFKIKQEKGSG